MRIARFEFEHCLRLNVLLFQNLAAEKTYNNLDVSLREANEHRNEWFEGVQSCKLDETLFTVMERIVRAEVQKLSKFIDVNRWNEM